MNFEIFTVKRNGSRIQFWYICKNEAIKLFNSTSLKEKSASV